MPESMGIFRSYRSMIAAVNDINDIDSICVAGDERIGKRHFSPYDLTYKQWYDEYIRNVDADFLVNAGTGTVIVIARFAKHQQKQLIKEKLILVG